MITNKQFVAIMLIIVLSPFPLLTIYYYGIYEPNYYYSYAIPKPLLPSNITIYIPIYHPIYTISICTTNPHYVHWHNFTNDGDLVLIDYAGWCQAQ